MEMSFSENKAKPLINHPALDGELSKIKGIGGKRLEEIMIVIEKFLDV